jgi:hypothetical protein
MLAPTELSLAKRKPQTVSSVPSDEPFIEALRTIFGKRTIIFGEDPGRYDYLLALVAADVKPQTMREWLVVKDIVDAQWKFARIRGFKAGLMNVALPDVIANKIKAATGKELTHKQATHMRQQLLRVLNDEDGARASFAALLAESQLTMDGVSTSVFVQQMEVQLQIDGRADAAHERRNRAYAELEALRQQAASRADTPSLPSNSQGIRRIDASGSIAPAHPEEAAAPAAGHGQTPIGDPEAISEGGARQSGEHADRA